MAQKRECTDGEWPCEMSTYLASLEAENLRLKSILADLREGDCEKFKETGKFGFDEATRKRIHEAI